MSFSFSDFSSAIGVGGGISNKDVLAIRRAVWPNGSVSRGEAEALFELHRRAVAPGSEWNDFFIEAISDTVLNATEPKAFVDEDSAGWLIGQLDRDERAIRPVEIELVVRIVEKALNAPDSLKAWALARVERSVLTGEGPARQGGVRPGVVDEAEVNWLRRLVFASGGDGAVAVSRDEAEMLWRIKDATLGAANAPGWQKLFVQAVGNHLMAWSSHRPLERTEAGRLEAFMNDRRGGALGFISRKHRPDFKGAAKVFRSEESAEDHSAAVRAAACLTPSENVWLEFNVARDSKRDELEEALIRFLDEDLD
jgi:hypothetical protein